MRFFSTALAIASLSAAAVVQANDDKDDKVYKYVLAFSVDGFHSSDVDKYLAVRPKSTIAKLLDTGYEYTDAFTSAV